jgi:flagellar motor switch/type III secretory pathway protein FliN
VQEHDDVDEYADVHALDVLLGALALMVELHVPSTLELRVPPASGPAAWTERVAFDAPVVLGRCAISLANLGRLAPRQVITLGERCGRTPPTELAVLGGAIGLSSTPGALVATVATGYVPREMALPDAHVELTVTAGTKTLTLRQILELAPGQIVPLGRPLAGPFEVRAEGRVLGRGELVDVDGELAVRIVSLGD